MNNEEKTKLKKAIEDKISETSQLIMELKDATKPMGLDNSVGRLSRMDYINNKSIDEAGLRSAESKLLGLKRWLSLFGSEKFGKCAICNNDININRLLLMPESSLCIHCAERR
jgi:DnaK suppressor protein